MKRALFYTFIFVCIMYVVQMATIIAYGATHEGHDTGSGLPAMWTVAAMGIYSVIAIVLFLRLGWAKASRCYMRSRPWDVVLWSVVAALGAIVPSLLLEEIMPQWTGWAGKIAEETAREMGRILSSHGGYIVIALLPPVVEELVFRGAVLRSLLKWKPERKWLMIVISAAIFALVHINPAQMPHTFIIGLLLGWMYMRTGSIVPGVAYHWANNTAAYVMFHVYHNPENLSDIIGPGTKPALLALLFSLCVLLPSLIQLNYRMKRAEDSIGEW